MPAEKLMKDKIQIGFPHLVKTGQDAAGLKRFTVPAFEQNKILVGVVAAQQPENQACQQAEHKLAFPIPKNECFNFIDRMAYIQPAGPYQPGQQQAERDSGQGDPQRRQVKLIEAKAEDHLAQVGDIAFVGVGQGRDNEAGIQDTQRPENDRDAKDQRRRFIDPAHDALPAHQYSINQHP